MIRVININQVDIDRVLAEYSGSDFRDQVTHNMVYLDEVDAHMFSGDLPHDPGRRPAAEFMIARWVRKLIETPVSPPTEQAPEEEKMEQLATARRFLALIIQRCDELELEL